MNKEGIKIGKQSILLDKAEINGADNFFINLRDQKENFTNHTTTRLTNPSKYEV